MDGLDQPSTAGAAAALPGGGGTIRQPAPRRRGRAATSWGAAERGRDAAAVMVHLDHGTQRGAGRAMITGLLNCCHVLLEFRCSPIGRNMVLNLLSRYHPT